MNTEWASEQLSDMSDRGLDYMDTARAGDWTSDHMDTTRLGIYYEQREASGKRASNCPELPDFGTISGKRTTNPPESAPGEESGRNKCLFSNCSPERDGLARNKCTISTSHRFYRRAGWDRRRYLVSDSNTDSNTINSPVNIPTQIPIQIPVRIPVPDTVNTQLPLPLRSWL